jgi:two-component system KDP operon response regulator KdpE
MASPATRILIVDDEPQILKAMRIALKTEGYEPLLAETGEQALDQVALQNPDLIVLDLALPGIDGLQVCRRIREWSQVPIIVLTVRRADDDKVEALDSGADDYLTKPFSTRELLARIRANLRRWQMGQKHEPVFSTGDLIIDFTRRVVTLHGNEIKLTRTEYEMLRYLAQNADKVVTHRQLLREVWGPGFQDEAHYLHVYIGHLRQKIELSPTRPRYLITEPGVGYRLRTSE